MKKRVFGVKFSRNRKSRGALLRSLLRALILDGKVTTTKTKSKYLVREFEKLVNIAKPGDVNSKRKVVGLLGNQNELLGPLFEKIVPTFVDRKGGFVKTTPLVARKGDGAELSRVEFTKTLISPTKTKKSETKKLVSGKKTVNKEKKSQSPKKKTETKTK